MSPRMIHSNPSRMPHTSTPPSTARMVAALIALLIPGAGPPLTRMASLSGLVILPSRAMSSCSSSHASRSVCQHRTPCSMTMAGGDAGVGSEVDRDLDHCGVVGLRLGAEAGLGRERDHPSVLRRDV